MQNWGLEQVLLTTEGWPICTMYLVDIMGYGFLDIHLPIVQCVLPSVQYLSHTYTMFKDNKCKAPGKEKERERTADTS